MHFFYLKQQFFFMFYGSFNLVLLIWNFNESICSIAYALSVLADKIVAQTLHAVVVKQKLIGVINLTSESFLLIPLESIL